MKYENKSNINSDPYTWNVCSIKKILTDRSYIGEFCNFKSDGRIKKCSTKRDIVIPIPAIISEDVFNQVPKSFGLYHIYDDIKERHLQKKIKCTICLEEGTKRKIPRYPTLSAKPINGKEMYICYNCGRKVDASKLDEIAYKALHDECSFIVNNPDKAIAKYITILEVKDEKRVNRIEIEKNMRSLFEQFVDGKISYDEYQKSQKRLLLTLLNDEIQHGGFNYQQLTSYDLKNRIIRYINSLDMKEEDHLKFIRENAIELSYSFRTGKITKIILSFMK